MPRIFRSMYEEGGKPRTGADTCELGVRPPGHPINADVDVDSAGNVVPDGRGMSVFPSILPADLKRIPRRLIPLRLASKVPGAAGDDDLRIWRTGAGPFASGTLTARLALNVTSRSHGTVCPTHLMPLKTLQMELASTQPDWVIDEP